MNLLEFQKRLNKYIDLVINSAHFNIERRIEFWLDTEDDIIELDFLNDDCDGIHIDRLPGCSCEVGICIKLKKKE